MIRPQPIRKSLTFERLEKRCVLATSFPVDGWHSITFDDGTAGDLNLDFSRDVPTVDPQGNPVSANQPRFASEKLVTEVYSWSQVLPAYINSAIGSGWDHDGSTPFGVLVERGGSGRLLFFRGNDFTEVNSIVTGYDLMQGTVDGYRYQPTGVIVHEGLVVFQASRSRFDNEQWITEGTSFLYTQDYGATIQRVPQVGGGFDVPPLADQVADGLARNQTWGFDNAFPEKSATDRLGAWFPWGDYIHNSYHNRRMVKGGQVGLFRARRPAVGEPWVVEPNLLVFERWEPADAGKYHVHSAGMFDDGLASFWGDEDYRNHMARHIASDLENYTTSTWTHNTDFNGAWSPDDAKVFRAGNQGVSVAPAPQFGEFLVTGDQQPELIMTVARPDDPEGEAIISNDKGSFPGSKAGAFYAGRVSLGIHHLRERGYVIREVGGQGVLYKTQGIHYSQDGKVWTYISNGSRSMPKLYGDYILQARPRKSDEIFATLAPQFAESFAPLTIRPGGMNLSNTSWDEVTPPFSDNVIRAVELLNNEFRYVDDGQLVIPQPASVPPVMTAAPIFEVTTNGVSEQLGLRNASDTESNGNELHRMDVWYYNLGSDALTAGLVFNQSAHSNISRWVANNEWTHGYVLDVPDPGATQVAEQNATLFTRRPTGPQRWLMAVEGLVAQGSPSYPLAPESSGSDELAVVNGFDITHDWTVGLAFGLPQTGGFSTWHGEFGANANQPIATLFQDPQHYIEVEFDRLVNSKQSVVLTVYDDGQVIDSLELSGLVTDWEDRIHLVISGSKNGLNATMFSPRDGFGIRSLTLDDFAVMRPQSIFLSANAQQDKISTLEWYAVQVNSMTGLTIAEQESFIVNEEMFSSAIGPPKIANVKVGSTAWQPAFVNWLDPQDGLGFDIWDGIAQKTPLPWSNIDKIFIQFSEHVEISPADVQLTGMRVPDYGSLTSFHYDSAQLTAVISLAAPLQADQLILTVSDRVTDNSNRALDGEWVDGQTRFPSGNSVRGGDFQLALNVLPGDVNRDGSVMTDDLELVTGVQSSTLGDIVYSPFFDVDGSGSILGNDLVFVQTVPYDGLPVLAMGTGPPRIRSVKVNSTAWADDFRSFLDPVANVGYAIPTGTNQLLPLPWVNIDQVAIEFDQPVQITPSDMQLVGVNMLDYGLTATFEYDNLSQTAWLNLSQPISADRLGMFIADSVTNLSGEALDGEWISGVSTYDSGNSIAGGNFFFEFNVLPGDASQDAVVLGNDLTLLTLLGQQFVNLQESAYSAMFDLDGDTVVLANLPYATDLTWAQSLQFTTLPAQLPLPPENTFRQPIALSALTTDVFFGGDAALSNDDQIRHSQALPPAWWDRMLENASDHSRLAETNKQAGPVTRGTSDEVVDLLARTNPTSSTPRSQYAPAIAFAGLYHPVNREGLEQHDEHLTVRSWMKVSGIAGEANNEEDRLAVLIDEEWPWTVR